ncbi:MAG: AtpZ/AtpI family protein [Bacillota bacterium]|nr:AtpZ/AtpI family protein [Bacillota bacterium]HOB92176.1 AtpZ/AtpI family protein [Bacillota bacterium]HPZ55228.1 AtpZ/AtpI family protein [Bacillota bacterium]HQD18518.1 AtpZ/AtpI family protein [Bacillota bacterium]
MLILMGFRDSGMILALKYLGTIFFNLAFRILGGFFLGRYLDHRLQTEPLLSILLVLLGIFSSFYSLYKAVKKGAFDKPDSGADNRSGERGG